MYPFKKKSVAIILSIPMLINTGCVTTSCITPPISKYEGDKSKLVDLSAKLDQLPLTASIKLDFKNVVKSEFDKLSDKNASLLLFLSAIDCYLQKGKIGQSIAQEMASIVREQWGASNGLLGTAESLTPVEKNLIKESPLSETIFTRLRSFGIQ